MFLPSIDRITPVTLVPALQYGKAGDTALPLDLVLPQDGNTARRPAAVWLFGGGWLSGSRGRGPTYWCSSLAAHGIVSAAVDYRLSQYAPFPAQIHDVKAAIRWLRANADSYQIDPDRIGIWGHSAGGHLAALAALTGDLPTLEGLCGTPGVSSRVQAAAIASANSDFLALGPPDRGDPAITQLFGGGPAEREELMRLANPITHIHPGAPPCLIAHGTRDETVPFSQGEQLHRALVNAGVPVEFIPIDGGYHNWNQTPDATWPEVRYFEFAKLVVRFFQQHL